MAKLTCKDGTVVQISDETEAELRKAFKPKQELHHGDYGYYYGHKSDTCVVYRMENKLRLINRHVLCVFDLTLDGIQQFDRRGNIFDDLQKEKI